MAGKAWQAVDSWATKGKKGEKQKKGGESHNESILTKMDIRPTGRDNYRRTDDLNRRNDDLVFRIGYPGAFDKSDYLRSMNIPTIEGIIDRRARVRWTLCCFV